MKAASVSVWKCVSTQGSRASKHTCRLGDTERGRALRRQGTLGDSAGPAEERNPREDWDYTAGSSELNLQRSSERGEARWSGRRWKRRRERRNWREGNPEGREEVEKLTKDGRKKGKTEGKNSEEREEGKDKVKDKVCDGEN